MTVINLNSRRNRKQTASTKPNRVLTSAGVLPGDGESATKAHTKALENAKRRLDGHKLEPSQLEESQVRNLPIVEGRQPQLTAGAGHD